MKRTQDVIYIFEKILKKVPAKLLMVGDGPERPYCEQLCRDLGVCEHVRFLGKQDAVEEILSGRRLSSGLFTKKSRRVYLPCYLV
mgnify:CR=1 FL=1